DDLTQFENTFEHRNVRIACEYPGEYIGIEEVPLLWRADVRADFGPALDQTLGGQNAHGFAVGGARHPQLFDRFNLAAKNFASPDTAGHDGDAEILRDRPVQTKRFFSSARFHSRLRHFPHSICSHT